MRQHVFTALVENKPGVLQRVASMFTRRRFNIDSISVGPTDNADIARMTVLTTGDDKTLEQIEKQMNKIISVIKVTDLSMDKSICRELCLIKLHCPEEKNRSQIMQYVDVFRARIVDVTPDTLTVEVTGDPEKIDAFIKFSQKVSV